MMGGIDNSLITRNDLWEYDITNNSWTQKTNFPGPERYGAVSFVLNNFGFVVSGGNDNGYLDDLWEYDPQNNFWLQKTGLPATQAQRENQRIEAFAFVANGKAYLGGGSGFVFGANQTNNYAFTDLWEYDPIGDDWTAKSGFPDFFGRNMSVAVSLNGKGYVGLGCNVDQTVNLKTFWEYDPSSDTWTAKADFPTDFTVDAGAVVYNNEMYVVGGVNLNPVSLSNQVYKYDPVLDTWTQLSAFNGNAIAGEFAVTTATSAFIGCGYNGNIIPRNDLYEISSSITGVSSTDKESNSSFIFPNPAIDRISIYPKDKFRKVKIYNSIGELVLSVDNNTSEIPIKSFSPGKYSVWLYDINGQISNSSFIKN